MTLLYKVLRSENSEENSEASRLFTGANLVLRPAYKGGAEIAVEIREKPKVGSGTNHYRSFDN